MTELLKPTEFLTREGARLGAMQGFYFKMAANLHQRLGPAVAAAKLAEQALLSAQHDEEQYYAKLWEACDTENAAVGISIEIIVFCAMSLEAAIYDYAAWHLGDTYVQSHLDKLDLLSKWLVVPRLITGRAIPVGRPPYERLKGLVASRNALVHAKSIPMPVAADGKIPRIDTDAFSRDVLANARTAMMAVILISLEMDKRFGDITINPLPSFDKESVKHSDFSTELRSLISDCRGTLKKSWAKDAPKKKTA